MNGGAGNARQYNIHLVTLLVGLVVVCGASQTQGGNTRPIARIHDSGFPLAHDTYNGMEKISIPGPFSSE